MGINIYPYFHLAVYCVYARYVRRCLEELAEVKVIQHSNYKIF